MPVLAAEADIALAFAMRHTFKVGRTKVGVGVGGILLDPVEILFVQK